MPPRPNARELFYRDDKHQRHDADLHEDILADGDDNAAKATSEAVMKRIGLSDDAIDRVLGRAADDAREPPDAGLARMLRFNPNHEPAGTSVGGQFAESDGGGGGSSATPSGKAASAKPAAAKTVKAGKRPAKAKVAGPKATSVEFVSPNVDNLTFDGAVKGLASKRQAALRSASADIDKELKLDGATENVIGAWSDGAENTIMDTHTNTKWTDWNKIALSAAMKGWLGDQKSVLAFQDEPERKPRESVPLRSAVSDGTFQVEINPTAKEIRAMVRDQGIAAGSEDEGARILIDADGNLYAWDATEAIHADVAHQLDLDERHEDIWLLHGGKLVSQHWAPFDDPEYGEAHLWEGAAEVREKLDSLEGNSVLMSFDAKGGLDTIHKNLLSDGLAFHTLVPHEGGATVYAVAVEHKDVAPTVAAVKKAARRYGSKITPRHGRGELIGDKLGTGSDREQRDRARGIYEADIERSAVPSAPTIWKSIRDRWGQALADAPKIKP